MLKDSYYVSIYNNVVSATEELSNARQVLGHFNYLSEEESVLIRRTLHLLYQKLVRIGEDISNYNAFKTESVPLPESEAEQSDVFASDTREG